MQINIQDIIPFMKKGWVAMDWNGDWRWFDIKPIIDKDLLQWENFPHKSKKINGFDIALADDWTKSLIKVGGK